MLIKINKLSVPSKEVFFVLFLLSGYVKGYQYIFDLGGIDFTLLIALTLFSIIFINIMNRSTIRVFSKQEILGVSLLSLFALWLSMTILYTESEDYYINKSLNFGVCFLAYLFPILSKKFNYQKFLYYFHFFSFLIVIFFFVMSAQKQDSILTTDINSTYLVIGYLCGLNVLLLQANGEKSFIKLFFFFSLLLSGARGPLIFTVIFFISLNIFSSKSIKRIFKLKILIYSFPLIILISIFIFNNSLLSEMIERSFNRLLLLTSSDHGLSVDVRLDHIKNSINYIYDNPILGYGFGSYGVVSLGEDVRAYPHNSILEVWFELGILGLLLYILFVLYHILLPFFKRNIDASIIILYIFLNSLKSSSFSELKIMFGFFGVYLLIFGGYHIRNKKIPSH